MMYLPAKFFEKDKASVIQASNLYSHIIIDEYQDINQVQQFFYAVWLYKILISWLFGDVDQTI